MNQAITDHWKRVAAGEVPSDHEWKYRSDYRPAADRNIVTHFCRPGEPCKEEPVYAPGGKGTGRRQNAINLFSRNI